MIEMPTRRVTTLYEDSLYISISKRRENQLIPMKLGIVVVTTCTQRQEVL